MRPAYTLVLAVVALAGCATQNQRHTEIHDAMSSTVYQYQDPTEGDATLTLIRDHDLWGAGCSSAIYVDDKVVADMEVGQQLTLHLPSGSRKLSLLPHGACDAPRVDADATLGTGETRVFRISPDGGSLTAEKHAPG
ncbi:hypothetical protein EC912_105145 [Luteibacter rhizovicinus]|uniref:Uncharacterized protein n=1 Tax=Luteibacter rhizovicinus TaxID=242606 RepID=A0A4R3YKL5_9GAMM|nr:hypothetical protein [Luteibacter rhizovicinus]TCV93285.1 hypothetical protein EC912_105145 [Luteibacter rhizovicinus]